jgi:hypothetical protein
MSLSQDKTPPRLNRRIVAEDRAWCHLYRSAGDPAVAAEVVQHLRTDVEAARCHLALYLRCRQTLRARKDRVARNQRISRLVRHFIDAFVSAPAVLVRKLLRNGGDTAIARVSQTSCEPATRRVRALTGEIAVPQVSVPASVELDPTRAAAPTAVSAEPLNARAVKAA